jgi:hypothetical protein
MIVLYLGPDSLLPIGSILAAVAGFVLLFWNRITGFARRSRRHDDDGPGAPTAAEDASLDSSDDEGR